jgi:hypothetical protein
MVYATHPRPSTSFADRTRKPGKQLHGASMRERSFGLLTAAAGVRLGSYGPQLNAGCWVLASTHGIARKLFLTTTGSTSAVGRSESSLQGPLGVFRVRLGRNLFSHWSHCAIVQPWLHNSAVATRLVPNDDTILPPWPQFRLTRHLQVPKQQQPEDRDSASTMPA